MRLFSFLKITLIILIAILFVLIIKERLYDPDRIQISIDEFRAWYYERKENKNDNVTLVPTAQKEKSSYIQAFTDLPKGFFYTGHTLLFEPQTEISINEFCTQSFKYTRYFKISDYERSLRKVNHLNGDSLVPGNSVIIPGLISNLIYNLKKNEKPELPNARTLYFSGKSICSPELLSRLPEYKKLGINAIVFDVKDIPGFLSYKSRVELAIETNAARYSYTDDMRKIIRYLKAHDIYVIARIACFRDNTIAKARPDLAIQSAKSGTVWNKGKGEVWLDPTNKRVQDYTIDIAKEAASTGVDEIQFDYIRFPTTGDLSDAQYAYSFGNMKKEDTITLFLKRAYQELQPFHVYVSIDIFGVVAWGHSGDIAQTGQRISKLGNYCDVISPMLYPSHFNDNFKGFKHPGDNPYYFISEGVKKVQEQAPGTLVRPWLQAFAWRVSNYNPDYIVEQVKASVDTESSGYLFWNAKNSYGTVLEGMKRLPEGEK